MVALLLSCLAVPRAEAAELKGFGPIEFGMSTDEARAALEALDLRWEWVTENQHLRYLFPIHNRTMLGLSLEHSQFNVQQFFLAGKAVDAGVQWNRAEIAPADCLSDAHYFIAAIRKKYEEAPLLEGNIGSFGLKNLLREERTYLDGMTNLYTFPFEAESLIRVSLRISMAFLEPSGCDLFIWYHAPVPDPIPF